MCIFATMKEKYQKNLLKLEKEIPMVAQLTTKPFGKEAELQQMKSELFRLEREITIKIQENQLKQNNLPDQKLEPDAAVPVIKMVPEEAMQATLTKVNGNKLPDNGIVPLHNPAVDEQRIQRSRMRL